jgi:hypothetical protein
MSSVAGSPGLPITVAPAELAAEGRAGAPAWWQRLPALPLGLTLLLLSFVLLPSVRANAGLMWSFAGVGAGLLAWDLALWAIGRRRAQLFRIEFAPVKSHYVQACVQFGIIVYWGLYWPAVYAEMHLILAQVIFLYALEGLVTWSRGRVWRLGFGPLPIIFSTNLLLWFRDEWFFLQFLMVAAGALAKQFVTWQREGRRTHIFNPSAFGQFLFAVVLIATGTTKDFTWGKEIAASFDTPHMLIVIFLGGLVVQYLFHVTLMTVAAAAMLVLANLAYAQVTGVYYFVNINIAAPIFLGIHLLVTDPATSPRTNAGRILFGSLYGLGYFALFRILDLFEVPLFWDKLLPVPILNLCVPLIDRTMRSGWIGRWNGWWETALPPARLNLVHMGCWVALFGTLWATGYIEAPHPGDSIPFWKKAVADGKPHAGHSLVMAAGAQAEGRGSGAAYNELGLICMEGRLPGVRQSNAKAAQYFAKACELGDLDGCGNVATQFLFLHEWLTDEDVQRAFDRLEQAFRATGNERSAYLLASAYETGRGRPMDRVLARKLYGRCRLTNLYALKGLARLALSGDSGPTNLQFLTRALDQASAGDAEAAWYLAYMHLQGVGVAPEEAEARRYMAQACKLGMQQACEALTQDPLPAFAKPLMAAPGWTTAFPVPNPAASP